MQQSHPAMLAGGHEKHFNFLPAGDLVTKKSRLREVYFYVWLCRLAGKPLLHSTSIESFLEELHCPKKAAADAASVPGTSSSLKASEPQAKIVVGAQVPLSLPSSNLCEAAQGECAKKEIEGESLYSVQDAVAKGVGKKADCDPRESASVGDAYHRSEPCHTRTQSKAPPDCQLHCPDIQQKSRPLLFEKSGELDVSTAVQCTSEPAEVLAGEDTGLINPPHVCDDPPRTSFCVNEQNLSGHLPSVTPSDEALWRTLLIPGFSESTDNFAKFSLEYRRQARAILPWLPHCLGTVEHLTASSSSTSTNQSIANEASCQSATTAAQCPTSSVSSARPTAEVVMENLLHGMSKPAVLDTKLGTKYYGELVSAAKREKEAQYARERGTYEVGMAFCGYFCGSPFEKDAVSVSGGSRAPDSFKHPKTLQAFSELFQAFLMLQGDVDIAIALGRFFARRISEFILLWRSVQEKPLVNFFGSSVLFIYDAGKHRPVNVAVDGRTEGAGHPTFEAGHFTSSKEVEEVKLERRVEGSADVKGEIKEKLLVNTAEDTAVIMATGKQHAVEKAEETTGSVSDERKIQKAEGKFPEIMEGGSAGNPNSKCTHTTKEATATGCEIAEESGVPCISSDITGSTRKGIEASGRSACSCEVGATCIRSVEPPILNAKVRIVDFAHVVVLPQHVEKGFIFGLQNLLATLDLATQSMENSKRCQLHPAH